MRSVLIIGVGSFGSLLVKNFSDLGLQIMAVDRDESRINSILPLVTDAQIGDSTVEAFLRSLGINNYDLCIVTIGEDFQSSLETTSLLKELGAKFVVSRADRDVQEKFLLRNGADEVINPEKQTAEWASVRYASEHILDYIKLDADHAILEVDVPSEWTGNTVGSIDIRKRYGINILAVRKNGEMDLDVAPETVLENGQSMLVLGERKNILKCFHI